MPERLEELAEKVEREEGLPVSFAYDTMIVEL
jgi:hypothetical protein